MNRKIGFFSFNRSEESDLLNHDLLNMVDDEHSRIEWIDLNNRGYKKNRKDNNSKVLEAEMENSDFRMVLQDSSCFSSFYQLNYRFRKKGFKIPIVAIINSLASMKVPSGIDGLRIRSMEKSFLLSVDAWLVPNQGILEGCKLLTKSDKPSFFLPPSRTRHTVPDFLALQNRLNESDGIRILTVSSLAPYSGILELISCLGRLKGLTWELDIIGNEVEDKVYVKKVKDTVRSLGLEERVVFWGEQSGLDLERAFRRAHVFTLPAHYEGSGEIFLEALGWGLPVICGVHGAGPGLVIHDRNGFFANPSIPSSLEKALQILLTDRGEVLRLARNAGMDYLLHPTRQEVGQNMKVYLDSLGR